MTLDSMNLRILERLQADARRAYTSIAEELNRSESTVRDRIRGLEEAGVVRRYTTLLDEEAVGLHGKALIRASVSYCELDRVMRALAGSPNVTHVHHTSGDTNLAFGLVAPSLREVEAYLEKNATDLGLRRLETSVVLRTVAEAKPVPLREVLRPLARAP